MCYGFVYVLNNPSMPGLFKIGRTERSPHRRAEELSSATSVPTPFQVVMYGEFIDHAASETKAHRDHSDCREAGGREFFRLSPARLQSLREEMEEHATTFWCNEAELFEYASGTGARRLRLVHGGARA